MKNLKEIKKQFVKKYFYEMSFDRIIGAELISLVITKVYIRSKYWEGVSYRYIGDDVKVSVRNSVVDIDVMIQELTKTFDKLKFEKVNNQIFISKKMES